MLRVPSLRSSPDRSPRLPRRRGSRASVPSRSNWPWWSTTTWPPSCETKSMSWSITSTACLPTSDLTISAVCVLSAAPMPAVGSSSSSSSASVATTMPISSHCFSPCERLPASVSRRGSRSIIASISSARARASASPLRPNLVHQRRSRVAAIVRLSITDSATSTPGVWNLRQMPWPTIACSASAWISRPWNRTVPAVGRTRPMIASHIVDLPAPLGR